MPLDKSIAERMRTSIGDSLIPHRHTALLVAIISLLGVRALVGGTGDGAAIYSILVASYATMSRHITPETGLVYRTQTAAGSGD
jgi:hypothetical protein